MAVFERLALLLKTLKISTTIDMKGGNQIGEKGINYLFKAHLPIVELINVSDQQVSEVEQRLITQH